MVAARGGTQALDACVQPVRPPGFSSRVLAAVLVTMWFGLNWIYQVVRKPSELFFPVSGVLYKLPDETWDTYESVFRKHSTGTITPAFLAALAQIEASGNPIARTYWRWSLADSPFDLYRPASSAVGMYQITDGTFAEARRYCIHDHVVVEDGPWHDVHSCWFNSLYTRVIASHSVELTSAYLDQRVARALANARISQGHAPAERGSRSADPSVRRRCRRAVRAARAATWLRVSAAEITMCALTSTECRA